LDSLIAEDSYKRLVKALQVNFEGEFDRIARIWHFDAALGRPPTK
jgi:hypothetical protein